MKKTISIVILILTCIVVFGVSYIVLTSNKTTKAIVLNTAVEPGVIVTEDMVTEMDIPAKTPEGYLKNVQSVVGYKTKTRIEKNQLLYVSNFMSSWTNYSDAENIPEDYVITSVSIPDLQACGGVITAGDYVDIMAVFKNDTVNNTSALLGDPAEVDGSVQSVVGEGRADSKVSVGYVLSNVYVLNTNSSLASSQDSDVAVSNDQSASSSDPFYIFALSYDDAKKLRQIEASDDVELWMNICPSQNQEEGNSPLIKQMLGNSYSFLHDAQEPVQDKEGNLLVDNYYEPDKEALEEKKNGTANITEDPFNADNNSSDEATN